MSLNPVIAKKNKHMVSIMVILFFVFFGITINNVSFQYIFMIFGVLMFGVFYRKFKLPVIAIRISIFLFVMMIYALFNSLINHSGDYFEVLRFGRCIASTLFLGIMIGQYELSPNYVIRLIKYMFVIHAISVIACVFIPGLNELLVPISNHTKAFHSIRSSGLVSGEDAAGYLCSIGLIIEVFDRISNNKRPFSLVFLVFVVSSVFTSRVAMIIIATIICVTYVYLMKEKRISHASSLLIILVPMAILAGALFIITTPFASSIRMKLFEMFPAVNRLYQITAGSYLDYSRYTSAVYRHISVTDLTLAEIIFGIGIKSSVVQDPGYIKTIYSIGIIGLVAECAFHISLVGKAIKLSSENVEYKGVAQIFSLIVLFTLLWEFKYSFLFSSTFFEAIILIYISLVYYEKHNKADLDTLNSIH